MGASDLLEHLKAKGLTVEHLGGDLRLSPKAALSDELRALIRSHKSELIALLANSGKPEAGTSNNKDIFELSEAEHKAIEESSKTEANACTQVVARRQRVASMLENNPGIRYALVSEAESDPEDVILTLGIRDLGTCEIKIPKAKYDPFNVLRVIEQHSAGVA